MSKLKQTIKHLHENHFTFVIGLCALFISAVIYLKSGFYEAFGFWVMIGIPSLVILIIIAYAVMYGRKLK